MSKSIDKLASAFSDKARQLGHMTIVVDGDGKAYALPGTAEVIGCYDDSVRKAQILDDLKHAEAKR